MFLSPCLSLFRFLSVYQSSLFLSIHLSTLSLSLSFALSLSLSLGLDQKIFNEYS